VRKFFVILLFIIFLLILAVWSPWHSWNFNILNLVGINAQEKLATLKVKSLAGDIDIFLDGELKATAKEGEDFAVVPSVSTGEHLVSLKRRSNGNITYFELVRKLNFEPGIDVVLAYDLGPSEVFTEGHILYARNNFSNEQQARINISSTPENVTVLLDNLQIGTTSLKDIQLDVSAQHTLRFEKPGYDPLEFTIMPENQSDRDKLKGLTLTLEVNLFAQPVKVTGP
jgi:hypothetical protein